MSSSTKAEQYKQAGNAAFAKHDLDLALANFTTAIQLDPSRAAFPLNRAAVHLKLKEWTRAEKDATTALELDGGVNRKAWFRRAVARRNLGRLELAKQDLEDAKRHGAGADVDAELALLLQQLGLGAVEPVHRNEKLDTKQFPTPPSRAPPPAAPAPTADRLRAALAKPASSPSSSSNSPSSSRPPISSKPTPIKSGDLLNAVSTRRLTKTKEELPSSTRTTAPIKSAAASFAAKKEARLVREKEMMIAAAAARRENREDGSTTGFGLTTTTMAPVTVSESAAPPPVPSTSSPTPVSGSTSSLAPVQAPITVSSSSSSLSAPTTTPTNAINSPMALEAHFLALNARQIPRGDPERYGPLRRLVLEQRSASRERERSRSAGSGSWRDWMGQGGLTPDLLSEVVGEVVALFPPEPNLDANQEDQPHLEWVLPLLEGLTTCHRWESASLFLSMGEREAVKRVLERARRKLDAVAGKWGV